MLPAPKRKRLYLQEEEKNEAVVDEMKRGDSSTSETTHGRNEGNIMQVD